MSQIVKDAKGDCPGEAFVEFKDLDTTIQALTRHRMSLGARYE